MGDDQADATRRAGTKSCGQPTRATVRDTYDRIATHFAATREYAWPEVETFVDETAGETHTVGLDLGCGNCRHAELLYGADLETVVGVDVSRGLLETGRERGRERSFAVELCQADATTLPLTEDSIDLAVYVATLHHLPSETARRASLDELARVLDPDGRALVSAWSTAHDRFDATESFDTTIEWTLPGSETVDRFYHIYAPEDFERDLEASDLALLEWELSSGNCYATVVSPE
ncbi:class I SAM-dependent methyltransferase [Natronobacterium gregoryi]|nr:class I SAM-dependent methyltransferase [Natronobacterium gregoryi]AFZ71970.1 methylase involved in ubiquinone/menaquinone biosynthesis [Natronobacterium gregoryi SP2]PLK20906.1 class I SAM-dependent methyltransferase [Natronobacterium gregoryi SP2]SFJ19249.1 Ubiquinone/menaquinone biosynthesis C-methylase UbiE [Natronobacterium gregoryi]